MEHGPTQARQPIAPHASALKQQFLRYIRYADTQQATPVYGGNRDKNRKRRKWSDPASLPSYGEMFCRVIVLLTHAPLCVQTRPRDSVAARPSG